MKQEYTSVILSDAKDPSDPARTLGAFDASPLRVTGRPAWIWAAAFLLIFSLWGCTPSLPPQEPVTLSFAYPPDLVDSEQYESLVELFNTDYPHITVELSPNGWEGADILLLPEWQLWQLWENRQIVSLDAIIEQDGSFDEADFYPQIQDHLTLGGEVLGIPAGVDIGVMYYNKDLFDAYGVPYPQVGWTWADFLETAVALRDPAAEVFGYAPWSGDNSGNLDPVTFIYQHGGKIIDDWYNPTRTTFDDPLTIEAMEWYARLFHEFDVAPTPEQTRQAFNNLVSVGIVTGKVGMWIDSLSSQGQTVGAEYDFRWGIAPLPGDTYSAAPGWVFGYMITAPADDLQSSWLWIDFLTRQPTQDLAPPRRSVVESAAYKELMGDNVAAIDASLQDMMMVPYWTLFFRFGPEMQRFQRAFEQIISGDTTPEEALVQIQQ